MVLSAIPRFVALQPHLASAGQPAEEQLPALAAEGFSVVINLGLHGDPAYALPDEQASVQALGMRYVHIPVAFSSPTLGDLRRFMDAMAQASGQKVFVHCRHNKRVPVFIALDRVLRQGWTREAALSAMQPAWELDDTWRAFIELALARPAA